MSVDRLSVTVPAELGAQLRELAERRGETVSTVVTEAIGREVRLAALDAALAEATRKYGPISDDIVRAADAKYAARPMGKRRRRNR
jgi:predicted DNA-binding protein